MLDTAQVTVRDAREGDLPRILELLQQLSAGSSRGARRREVLGDGQQHALTRLRENPDYHLLVIESEGEVVGTATLYVLPDLDLGGTSWGVVEHAVVEESQRGKGFGGTLMHEVMRVARESGCYKLSLNSGNQRLDTHRFYEGIGFRSRSKGFSFYG